MQLEMNSFVQENAWIQNPWIVHAVSMKTYQRQDWKPLGQARKPIQMCRESVSIVLCVCVWVCVCFRLIHQKHELNERITHTWLTASIEILDGKQYWPLANTKSIRRTWAKPTFVIFLLFSNLHTHEASVYVLVWAWLCHSDLHALHARGSRHKPSRCHHAHCRWCNWSTHEQWAYIYYIYIYMCVYIYW